MILRKPYAFLIKHFQKINLILLLLACYILYKNLNFYNMVTDYIATTYYNPLLMPMSDYTSFLFYIAIFGIIFISGVLIYLLYYKKKPVLMYWLVILEYILVFAGFLFAASYFNGLGFSLMDLQRSLLIRDILLIVSVPQYVILLLLLIRTLGLDLKKFGFREDEEYMDIAEEDREEFEVELGLDIHDTKRFLRQKLRFFSYFVKEHKFPLSIAISVLLIFGLYQGYQTIFVNNRIYHQGEKFRANSYEMVLNHVYFTGKDYAGEAINSEDRKYIILDLSITNVVGQDIAFNTDKMVIAANHRYYTPIRTHDQYFKDLGDGYQLETLKPGVENHYLFIYEILPSDLGSNYTLYYQETISDNELKLRRIDFDLTDLNSTENTTEKHLGEEMTVTSLNTTYSPFTIQSVETNDTFTYYYTSCYVWNCRVQQGTLQASSFSGNRTLLKLNYSGTDTALTFSNFLSKQAKFVYEKDGVMTKSNLTVPLSRQWQGKIAYFLIPKEALESNTWIIEFTARNQKYQYYIKGGDQNAETGQEESTEE